ncbi:WXG100 family type VII secretion target [Nonomuraea sp. H19]|uniref:WXG100 family type VII secretion target n=1 Tax=Nonomuraea sp. H19 TaxID=3452206 RepID=UPI003F8CCCFD
MATGAPGDEWRSWSLHPSKPGDWPGLGLDERRTIDVAHQGLGSVRTRLGEMVRDFDGYANVWGKPQIGKEILAAPPHAGLQLALTFSVAAEAISRYLMSLGGVLSAFSHGIGLANKNYNSVDFTKTADTDARGPGPSDYTAREKMPIQGHVYEFAPDPGDVRNGLSADDILIMFALAEPYTMDDIARRYGQLASDLVAVTHKLYQRALDMRDAWVGQAAETAQEALRRIYTESQKFAYFTGFVGDRAAETGAVLTEYRRTVGLVVDPDDGGFGRWLADLVGDPRADAARDHLRKLGEEYAAIYHKFPQSIEYKFPWIQIKETVSGR